MKKGILSVCLCALLVVCAVFLLTAPARAAGDVKPFTTTSDTTAAAVLDAWGTGTYSHVQLGADLALELSGSEDLVVDLAGYDLTVSGSGKVSAFDTANDGFDHTVCGTLTCEGNVTYKTTFTAPTEDGYYYIAYGGSGRYTFHRMDMKITGVSFRPSEAGLYYKAYFACDRLIEESVTSFGVAARVDGEVPTKDFEDNCAYTVNTGLISGTTVNSGMVQNILVDGESATNNKKNADTVINARLYIKLGDQYVMAPRYATSSLNNLLAKLDSQYTKLPVPDQNHLNDFHAQWKEKTSGWTFTNIGKEVLDFDAMNADLVFEEGTTNAYCYKCNKKVTWTVLSEDSNYSVGNGGHYCLTSDIVYEGTAGQFISTGTGGTACLHLNGHDITHTTSYAIFISSGRINIMGEGTVKGAPAPSKGGAIHANNQNAANGAYLYGGTYENKEGSSASRPVISAGDPGRNINIYKDATVNGNIYFSGSSKEREGYLSLNGCTVNGDVKLTDLGLYPNNISIVDATITGTLNVPVGHRVYLQGSAKIGELSVADGATVITKGLEEGTQIGVSADGYFVQQAANLGDYVDYFTGTKEHYGVFLRGNNLFCGKDYVSNLQFNNADGDASTNDAYCPVCDKDVTWIPLDQATIDAHTCDTSDYFYTLNGGGTATGSYHYYLTSDITYTGSEPDVAVFRPGGNNYVSCLHLNGHDITTTKRTTFYSSDGVLNVMGDGKVTGCRTSSSFGGAITSNNQDTESSMHFFSGEYCASNASYYAVRTRAAGGRIYFYEDAVINGGANNMAVELQAVTGRSTTMSFQGTYVDGDVSFNGIASNNTYAATVTAILNDATVKGTFKAVGANNVYMYNAVKIDLLNVSEDSKVIFTDGIVDGETINAGSKITVQNAGAFAYELEGAEAYLSCFRTAWRDDKIVCRDNVLTYKPNYEMGLQLDGNNQARCPVCDETVTWTAVTDEEASVKFTDGGHYYLPKDLNFDADSDKDAYLISGGTGTTTCLHLNGYDITSTQESAIAVSNGVINVMGEGTVQGNSTNTNYGAAVVANNSTATNGANLYSGTYKKIDANSNMPVVSVLDNGGNITVLEDAVVDAEGGVAAYIGGAETGNGCLTLDRATIDGKVQIAGVEAADKQSVVNAYHATVRGDVNVSGTNNITFSGETNITGVLDVADGSYVNFADMLQPDANIRVRAAGTFTSVVDKPRAWVNFFAAADNTDWVVYKDNALFCGEKLDLTEDAVAGASDKSALDAAYAGLTAKYGEMHNHTGAGLAADGRNTIQEWKDRMVQLEIDFATIVDHHQVAHMYHDDWQETPTEEYPVVFIGGSEPASTLSGLSKNATQTTLHYNMITGDVDKLISILSNTKFKKFNYSNKYKYNDNSGLLSWSYEDKLYNGVVNNKYKKYVPTEYSKDKDGNYDYYNYAKWTRTEFEELTAAFYEAGGLLVEVHPDYPSYIKSSDPLDYCFSGNAGTAEAAAMGFEIHTANYGYNPSRSYNEQAYQLWLDMLDLGKKVYATYGDDTHKLPTAMALNNIYASDGADAKEYMAQMNAGNFAPGWVGIRMMVGDTKMGGTADTFADQRLVFSIGDMYQPNEWSKIYRDKSNKQQNLTWEPGYDPTCTYTARLYDDSGLLMESEINPGDNEMDYFAIDADADAKFYRIEVWVKSADGAYNYRCGVGNPIWNAAAYATAE